MSLIRFRSAWLYALSLTLAVSATAGPIVHSGGTLGLALSPQADHDGKWHGALVFDLEPGWKTYWRDPGSSGIPPEVSATLDGKPLLVSIDYPMPIWIENAYGDYAGYSGTVTLPVTIDDYSLDITDGTLSIEVFAGVCASVCVPVTGSFDFKLAEGRAKVPFSDIMTVTEARTSLPQTVALAELVQSVEAVSGVGWQLQLQSRIHGRTEKLFVSAAREDGTALLLKPTPVNADGSVLVQPANESDNASTIATLSVVADIGDDKGVRAVVNMNDYR